MNAVIAFFEGIGSAVTGVIDFVISLVMDLVWLVQTLAWAMAQIPLMVFWIPTKIHALILTLFGIVMLYKILGREG